ncbi:hypothetical protein QWZ13_07065 [Reinekea marina]|uniref:hypothetical protein n=1 Tax=Reinekea marina TaxID=1310421 RepID=UPI0025B385AC|nr:hypothetical protein [Reinekea marina]MDN3648672.1 hypothetical protein [Reinekea marina]
MIAGVRVHFCRKVLVSYLLSLFGVALNEQAFCSRYFSLLSALNSATSLQLSTSIFITPK